MREKITRSTLAFFLMLPHFLRAGPAAQVPLSASDISAIHRFLERTEKGDLPGALLQDEPFRQKIVSYYLVGTNQITTRAKLPIGFSLLGEGHSWEAAELLSDYSRIYTNDWRGPLFLGVGLVECGAFGKAVPVLSNAAALAKPDKFTDPPGTTLTTAYAYLAQAAFLTGRAESMHGLAPRLPALVTAPPEEFSFPRLRGDTLFVAMSWAIGNRDQKLFTKVLESGIHFEGRSSITATALFWLACYVFDRAPELDEVRQNLKRALDRPMPDPDPADPLPITQSEIRSIRQRLDEQERGKTDNYDADDGLCGLLEAYYLAGTNRIPIKAKLAIARCFAKSGDMPRAAALAEEYVQVFSNDWRAWRVLGTAYRKAALYDKSFKAFEMTISLGSNNAASLYPFMAEGAMGSGCSGRVAAIVPSLLALKSNQSAELDDRYAAIGELMYYSIASERQDLFVQALEGLSSSQLLANRPLQLMFLIGHRYFKPREVEPLWQAYKKAAWEAEPKRE